MTKATTPQLRFREFTQDWQQQKLDATFTLISGQHLLPSEYSTDSGEVPYFAGPLDFTDDKKAIKKWAIYPSKIALNGDVLITVKGSGVGVLWFLILPKVAIGRQLMAIRGSGGSTTLLFHLLSTKRQRFQALAAGNMIPGLSRGDILQMPLSLPTTEEQRKIAAVFSAVDAKLDALRRKRALLAEYKRGVMQKLFSQEIRFVGDGGRPFADWKEIRLEDLGELVTGLTYSPSNTRPEGLLVLRSSNIQDGKISLEDTVFVNVKVSEKSLSQKDDILICVRNGSQRLIGKNAVIPVDIPLATHGAFMVVFRGENNYFVRHLLDTPFYYRQVHADLGARINSINNSRLRRYKFTIPSELEERRKIADFLTAVDDKITAVSQQITQMEAFKKGLLQQMFV